MIWEIWRCFKAHNNHIKGKLSFNIHQNRNKTLACNHFIFFKIIYVSIFVFLTKNRPIKMHLITFHVFKNGRWRRRGRDCINCRLVWDLFQNSKKFKKDFPCLVSQSKIRNTLSCGKFKRFFRTPDKIVVQKSFLWFNADLISYHKKERRIHIAGK